MLSHGSKFTTDGNTRFADNEDIVDIMLKSGFCLVSSGVQCNRPYCAWNEYIEIIVKV
jgi:hypothetical protein